MSRPPANTRQRWATFLRAFFPSFLFFVCCLYVCSHLFVWEPGTGGICRWVLNLRPFRRFGDDVGVGKKEQKGGGVVLYWLGCDDFQGNRLRHKPIAFPPRQSLGYVDRMYLIWPSVQQWSRSGWLLRFENDISYFVNFVIVLKLKLQCCRDNLVTHSNKLLKYTVGCYNPDITLNSLKSQVKSVS